MYIPSKESSGKLEVCKMDRQQEKAIEIAGSGHNLLLTGFPGTGKSFLLTKITKQCIEKNKKVFVTASTGKASMVLSEKLSSFNITCRPTTLHKLCGLGDGRHQNEELLNLLLNNDRYEKEKKNLKTCDCLIIDEVSMISKKVLLQVEFILRHLRETSSPFGGVQIILSGDFHQLPPVPSPEYNDNGEFLFLAEVMQYFHHVDLEDIHRQNEPDLVETIHGLARGELQIEHCQLLQRMAMKKGLPPGDPPVYLYATNFYVDVHNANCLRNLEGDEMVYHSTDIGDTSGMRIEKEIHLKLGSPVILLSNLSDRLVNGLDGLVKKMGKDSVTVYFPLLKCEEEIRHHTFTKFSVTLNKDIGSRTQIPLKLAWALTVHRAQGMSLDRVCVDCKGMFHYGQLTVAISRCKCKKGLQIKNFSKQLVKKPPEAVTKFYERPFKDTVINLSCCVKSDYENVEETSQPEVFVVEKNPDGPVADDFMESDQEDDINLANVLEELEGTMNEELTHHLPDEIKPTDILKDMIHKLEETIQQKNENSVIHYLEENIEDTKTFLNYLWNRLYLLKEKHLPESTKPSNKEINNFYKDFNKLVTSDEFNMKVKCLFGQNLTEANYNITFQVSCKLREQVVHSSAKPIWEEAKKKAKTQKGKTFQETMGGRAKIRYIAGWCVSKLKKKCKKRVLENLYKKKQQKVVDQKLKEKNLLEHLEGDVESSDQDSIQEISRKQNLRKGLTVVSDKAFDFFLALDNKIRSLESKENLNVHGSSINKFIEASLRMDTDLITIWHSLFADSDSYASERTTQDMIWEEIISKYLMMSLSQMRRDYLHQHQVTKKEATRKQIKMKTDTKPKKFDFQAIQNDKSENRDASHKRLQSECISNCEFLSTFQKSELHILSKAYGIHCARTMSKKGMCDVLIPKIISSDHMTKANVLSPGYDDSDEPGTSTNVSNRGKEKSAPKRKKSCDVIGKKGKGKQKKTTKWPCGVCGNDASYESVGCDGCDTWYHATCVQVNLDSLPDTWFCQTCILQNIEDQE